MKDVKWYIELIRIIVFVVTIIITLTLYGTGLDKQIALNLQSIDTIKDNHLVHIDEKIDKLDEKIDKLIEYLMQ